MNSMNGSTGMKERIPGGYRKGVINQFTPEQMGLFKQLFSNVGPESFLSRLAGGDESTFDQMEAPALRQFQGGLGNIASRFSGMGIGGRRSSGFQNTATSAMSDFSQQLQSQRQGLQRQAIMDLMGLSESLLNQRPYDQFLYKKREKKPSGLGGILGSTLGGIGGFLGGGPGGALAGAKTGFDFGSMF